MLSAYFLNLARRFDSFRGYQHEQRAITCSPQAPEVADHDADQAADGAAERRAGAEVRGWSALAGHQRCSRGRQGRHRGSVEEGRGLEMRGATKEERRLGERIARCGEHLIFRAPPQAASAQALGGAVTGTVPRRIDEMCGSG